MKKLLIVFLLLSFIPPSNPPFVSAEASSVYTTNPTDTLFSVACDPTCLPITYAWTKVSGPGVQTIKNGTTNTAVISGLQTGFYIFQSTVTSTTGLSASDTVGFLVNIPIIVSVPSPPILIHDTTIKTIHDTTIKTVHDTIAAKIIKTVTYFDNGTVQ